MKFLGLRHNIAHRQIGRAKVTYEVMVHARSSIASRRTGKAMRFRTSWVCKQWQSTYNTSHLQ